MGVRFLCPKGHKLNVKVNLAGKRGICPDCGVRFIVPHFSGGRVEPAEDLPLRPTLGPMEIRAPAPTAASSGAGSDAALWYVRPAAGGQYGPASTPVFQQWIAEGRVAGDSWVWRTGWADWKPGSEALALAAQPARQEPVAAFAAELDAAPAPATPMAQAPIERTSASARRAKVKRRKQKTRRLSAILGVVTLVTLVVLVGVLSF